MTTALFTAISGIRANQLRLNVISNNIANVNTLGFKSSTANFATVFASTLSRGSGPNGMLGGTNPMQVGNGTLVSQISSNFGQGGMQFTGRPTDLSVNGNGFFVVERVDANNGSNATDYYLTRAGNFSLDSYGNLVTASGNRIRGTSQPSGSSIEALGRVKLPMEFQITKDFDAAGNVLGTHFSVEGTDPADITAAMTTGATTQSTMEVQLVNFTVAPNGTIAGIYSNGDVITVRLNQATVDANPDDPSQWRTEIVHITSEGGTFAAGNQTASDAGMVDQIGDEAVFDGGVGLDIAGNGMEGMQLMIQMASVPNPEGLLYDGASNFLTSPNSGSPQFGSAGIGSRGTINSGTLESSNVDLAGEFTNMIVSQRGLEAASRVVRTQSEVMQTIIQMV